MKKVEGYIVDIEKKTILKGRVFYDQLIERVEYDSSIQSEKYILPGLVDAHVHIESSMLTPLEYSKIAIKHGVVAAVTDPHEIANVCGVDGINFMVDNAKKTPMKLTFGAPSCVPATSFETSGYVVDSKQIENLFKSGVCSHLSEMMNFPGVIYDDEEVMAKIAIANKYNKKIDGHAPLLSGVDLEKYVKAGISTDHECTNVDEAKQKIALGMKIMLRQSSAAKDFQNLITLISDYPEKVMFCTDDCHPDELEKGYINALVKSALDQGYNIFDVLKGAVKNAVDHFDLNVGILQFQDSADFIVVDDLDQFNICSTVINGVEVYDGINVNIDAENDHLINNFYVNRFDVQDLKIKQIGTQVNVIDVIEDSLLTRKFVWNLEESDFIESDIYSDILKLVVVNRYNKSDVSVGFVRGFKLKRGAIAGSIAHDSHNIIAVGVDDRSIFNAITLVQKEEGGLVVVDDSDFELLSLPVAGLMSDKSCTEVSLSYKKLSRSAARLGCDLKAPFMTLAFMSLLVIPELKLGDKGLFDVNEFKFIDLQN